MTAHFVIRIEVPPIDIRVHGGHEHVLDRILDSIHSLKETIVASNAELTAQLNAAADQADKSKAEIIAKVATLTQTVTDLEAVIAAGGGDPPPDLVAAVERVKTATQALDDLNPDAP